MEARFIQMELVHLLASPVFLDGDDAHGGEEAGGAEEAGQAAAQRTVSMRGDEPHDEDMLGSVRSSDVLLLLLSKHLFERPWCLLEIQAALEARIPIIGVVCAGKGYTEDGAVDLLRYLEVRLHESGGTEIIRRAGCDPLRLAWRASSAVPRIPTISFDPSGTRDSIHRSILDLIEAMSMVVGRGAGDRGGSGDSGEGPASPASPLPQHADLRLENMAMLPSEPWASPRSLGTPGVTFEEWLLARPEVSVSLFESPDGGMRTRRLQRAGSSFGGDRRDQSFGAANPMNRQLSESPSGGGSRSMTGGGSSRMMTVGGGGSRRPLARLPKEVPYVKGETMGETEGETWGDIERDCRERDCEER